MDDAIRHKHQRQQKTTTVATDSKSCQNDEPGTCVIDIFPTQIDEQTDFYKSSGAHSRISGHSAATKKPTLGGLLESCQAFLCSRVQRPHRPNSPYSLVNSFYCWQNSKPINTNKITRLIMAYTQIEHTRIVRGFDVIGSLFTTTETDCISTVRIGSSSVRA